MEFTGLKDDTNAQAAMNCKVFCMSDCFILLEKGTGVIRVET